MTEKVFDGGLMPGATVALGVDSSLTGFALSAVDVTAPNQHWTTVYSSKLRGIERLIDIRSWLDVQLLGLGNEGHTVTDIAIEAPVMSSPSTLKLAELVGIVRTVFWDCFYEGDQPRKPMLIPPSTLKKYTAGKGNAKKQEMLLQIYKQYNVEFNDDNAADAWALANLASGYVWSPYHEAELIRIHNSNYRDL